MSLCFYMNPIAHLGSLSFAYDLTVPPINKSMNRAISDQNNNLLQTQIMSVD